MQRQTKWNVAVVNTAFRRYFDGICLKGLRNTAEHFKYSHRLGENQTEYRPNPRSITLELH